MHILITINSCSVTPSCNPHQDLVQKLGNKLVPKMSPNPKWKETHETLLLIKNPYMTLKFPD